MNIECLICENSFELPGYTRNSHARYKIDCRTERCTAFLDCSVIESLLQEAHDELGNRRGIRMTKTAHPFKLAFDL